ncbi:MAG: hypothetical protein JSW71_14995 [Gemmatimonadota bacterium]|nr:MAG: hypothetical protein JSW71_14995 [Gemmatimonadota bacterium]
MSNDLVPTNSRFDRPALERIIQRAAELQSRERDIGDSLTEDELLSLGQEVGIAPGHLRQAMQEERTRALVPVERGTLVRLVGPRRVASERVIARRSDTIERELFRWMSEGELLQVKRRYPDSIAWEPKEGAWASLRRSLGVGGRKYLLARSREVVTRVTTVDDNRCLVQLIADLSNTRSEYLLGSGIVMGSSAAATGIALVLGVLLPVAVIPAVLGVPIAYSVARDRRRQVERLQVALEQILDRLEHEDFDGKSRPSKQLPGLVERVTAEIRKNLGIDDSRDDCNNTAILDTD